MEQLPLRRVLCIVVLEYCYEKKLQRKGGFGCGRAFLLCTTLYGHNRRRKDDSLGGYT